jgi:L-threonylcarbamoyladenylate synthase
MPHPPARIISIDPDSPDPRAIVEAAARIRIGQLVAFGAETVYGLGADATQPAAVSRIFTAKGRPALNPLIVHVVDDEMARACVAAWPEAAATLASWFWPGPLTLVLPRSGIIPDVVTAGRETVGVRVPDTTVALWLIDVAETPIAAPSANRSNRISPTRAEHVAADLGDSVDLILDSGPTRIGLESTVVDLTTREPRILRPGPITAAELEHALGGLRVRDAAGDGAAGDELPTSPGLLATHYAPRKPAYRVGAGTELDNFPWSEPSGVALIVIGPHDFPAMAASPSLRFDLESPEVAARELYAVLHQCDQAAVGIILIVPPPDLPEWRAVHDRVRRATRPWTA